MKKVSPKTSLNAKKRIVFVGLIFTIILGLLSVRILYLQTIKGDFLRTAAVEQQTRDRTVTSQRGTIYDRNMKPLAISTSVDTITASPVTIQKEGKVNEVASTLADILGEQYPFETIQAKLNKNNSYEVVARKIDKETSNRIREAELVGITIVEDSKRTYPYSTFASQVIGFTGTDNQGLSGIEKSLDTTLTGVPGRIISAKNAAGSDMPYQYEKNIAAENGKNVVLTIDETLQNIMEKHVSQGAQENLCTNGAFGIMMNAKTGEILAMVNYPEYDLNSPFDLSKQFLQELEENDELTDEEKQKKETAELERYWRNKCISDTYEPGSTFKIFTLAMALEENAVSLNDTFTCGGSARVGDRDISCWKSGGHGTQNLTQAVENSCNPAFIAIGQRVGGERFYNYFKMFGFMNKTGVDLLGETTGLYHTYENFNEVELATYSFGQGFTITPLQLVAAVSAVTNDGMMIRPHIVKSIVDNNGNVIEEYNQAEIRQIMSPQTASTIRTVLEKVVSEGSGGNAYVNGFRVAGKTGTSEKTPRGNGKYVASFCGFAPADDPEIICLIALDEPSAGQIYGGVIAAPIMGKIMEESLEYLGVERKFDDSSMTDITIPEIRNLSVAEAQSRVAAEGLTYTVIGNGDTVVEQMPRSGAQVSSGAKVILYTVEATETMVTVPSVIGQTAYNAANTLSYSNLNIKISGSNTASSTAPVAVKQTPVAGETVPAGTIVIVEFLNNDIAVH